MKKTILLASLLVMGTSAQAGEGAGCGLGAQVWDGQSGLPYHVMAATTNGTSGNQTFGMTSGTSGCDVNQPIEYHASVFVDQNMERMAVDMSQGQGESLQAFMDLLEVQQQDRAAFADTLRTHYAEIFTASDISSTEVLENIANVLSADDKLAGYIG